MAIEGKPRIVIWFVSNDGRYIGNAVNILERQHNGIDILGITAIEKIVLKKLQFIPLNELNLNGGGYDILLVVGARQIGMSKVTKVAKFMNLDADKLLGDWIVCIPGFTLEKYRQLKRSRLSIFAQHCFGGLLSHTLGLPFLSPLINMFINESEYIRFLRSPRVYMEERLVLQGTKFETNLKFDYPIYTLGNVSLNMNHYPDFDTAVSKWNERKQRTNWYNLFVTAYTESEEILEQFDELPYGKKVCFVPFKSNLDSVWYIDCKYMNQARGKEVPFWSVINGFASGFPLYYYDVFDMLLYGKKTPLIEM